MSSEQQDISLEALQEIRSIMDRSSRFLSLSGWSGVWAGCTALAGAFVAWKWLPYAWIITHSQRAVFFDEPTLKLIALAITVFMVALLGGLYFTWQKVKSQGQSLWSRSSRQLLFHLAIPLAAGGIFCLAFLYNGHGAYLAPACLVFYGLALINGSKFTLPDIRFLGILEVALGSINLFNPGNGIIYWAIGFGLLHILYGIIMWNKYDKKDNRANR